MKTLIIGGTGLISTAIVRELCERGDNVTLYNRGKSKADVPDGVKTIVGDRTGTARFETQIAELVSTSGAFDCVMIWSATSRRKHTVWFAPLRAAPPDHDFAARVHVWRGPGTSSLVRRAQHLS